MTGAGWWTTRGTINALPTACPQSAPCTWAQVLAAWPLAAIHDNTTAPGIVGFKAGSGYAIDANVDNFEIGINSTDQLFDFESETQCTTVCYVDGTNGNDSFGGSAMGSAKKTIQAALDAVSAGGTVRVLPGNYSET